MIFEHPVCYNFLSHTYSIFSLSVYCFGFRANTYFFFVNYGCLISCQPIGCQNNTPLMKKLRGTQSNRKQRLNRQDKLGNG